MLEFMRNEYKSLEWSLIGGFRQISLREQRTTFWNLFYPPKYHRINSNRFQKLSDSETLYKCGWCGIALFAIHRTFPHFLSLSALIRTFHHLPHSFALIRYENQ